MPEFRAALFAFWFRKTGGEYVDLIADFDRAIVAGVKCLTGISGRITVHVQRRAAKMNRGCHLEETISGVFAFAEVATQDGPHWNGFFHGSSFSARHSLSAGSVYLAQYSGQAALMRQRLSSSA